MMFPVQTRPLRKKGSPCPRPAPNHWPYMEHGTIAELREEEVRQAILDSLGQDEVRRRA